MRNLPDAGDGAAKAIPHQPSPPRLPPPANAPGNHHMNGPQTAKPHTKGAGLRKFDQLAGQIDFIDSKPQPQKQGHTEQQTPNYFERVVATIPKGRDVIRIKLTVINGETFVDIRKYRPHGPSMFRPTVAGVSLRLDAALSVATGIMQALAVVSK
jgi:hypothetical protein